MTRCPEPASFLHTELACLGLTFAAGLAWGGQAPSAPPDSGPAAASRPDPAIRRDESERTVGFLASDALEGRSTGSEGAVKAAQWLAERLREAGAEPAGDGGTYLQKVPFATLEYEAAAKLSLELSSGERVEAQLGVDFEAVSGLGAGGPLAVRVVRTPEELPAEGSAAVALFLDASRSDQRRMTQVAGRGWGLVVSRGSDRPGSAEAGRPPPSRSVTPGENLQPRLRVRGPLAERFVAGEVASLWFSIEGRSVERPAFNVLARVSGAGSAEEPELGREAIVFSAHYDHLGVKSQASAGEDRIFNGADDDASGCAAVLELAEAFAAGPRPARTLVFLFATGEEIGLVGTHHYLEHPVVPLERTVCNLNFEMIGRPDGLAGGPGQLWLTGFERSNLGPALAAEGLSVVADPRPDKHFFERSDNFAFALRGIVAQSLSSYDLHERYHEVSDEASTLDYVHMELAIQAAWNGARALADGRIDPAWLPGGEPGR